MTSFPTGHRTPSRKEVEAALASLDFPLSKEQLVERVEAGAVDDAVLHQIRALPLATYDSVAEVMASIEVEG